MIRILVVDDELVVRVGIKSMIDWNSHGFQIAGEAADGEDALKKIPELDPHIILTDIKMPKMDGIELIKIVREKYSRIKIVVLSCHNDFDFVKQAMKLGASDYILKLSMRCEELLEVMNNIKKEIAECVIESDQINNLYKKINSNMDVIKEKFFKKVINGNYLSPEDIYREAKELNIRFDNGVYIILASQINRHTSAQKKTKLEPVLLRNSILNIIEEVIPKDLFGDVFSDGNETFVTVFTLGEVTDEYNLINKKIKHFANYIHELIWTYLGVSVSTGMYDHIITCLDAIGDAYKKAAEACEHRFYFKESKLILDSELSYTEDCHEYFNNSIQKEIYSLLEVGEVDEIRQFMERMFNQLAEKRNITPREVRRTFKQIINVFHQVIREFNIPDEHEKLVCFNFKDGEIDMVDNIYKLQQWFDDCIEEYMEYYCRIQKGAYTEEILRLKHYISENYEKEITLKQAARFLNVGRNYFCSIFKKETGQTFYDYLINVRIEKAKGFLRKTGLKNYEVAKIVGYDNFNYFSTAFKKVVGVSPNEFRKKVPE